MPELSAQLPAIIGEAAKSPLGIFALMIISLAILGFFFFKEASEKTRIAIFSMLFVGVAAFGLSIVRATSAAEPAAPEADAGVDPSIESILGTWTADVSYSPPKSFRETFTFALFGGNLMATPTYLGSQRSAQVLKAGNGVVQFDIQRQEVSGDETTDITSTYFGEIHPDRIDFLVRHSNGDPDATFQARRADSR